jgi:tRNA(Ile)-lysidine synthase
MPCLVETAMSSDYLLRPEQNSPAASSSPFRSADPALPVSLDEARSLLAALRSARAVLLAVSGGPDSVALMRLAAAVARSDPEFPSLHVASVDHGLRPSSRAEAEEVVATATALGLDARILTWTGPKPATRLQERARRSRYELLVDGARRVGATHLVTAHTRDDQAETVLFRLLRGSGPAGLAGMAPVVDRSGILHCRPLLDVPKARLVATCRAQAWPFVEDPANRDPRFVRARLRQLMPALAVEGLDAARLVTLARRLREVEAVSAEAARHAVEEARRGPGRYDALRLLAEPTAVRHRALDLMVTEVGAAPGRPRLNAVERLSAALEGAAARAERLRRTLHGAVLFFDGHDDLRLAAAPPRRGIGAAAATPD